MLALVLVFGALALYWFVFRGPTTDAGKLEAWFGSACESSGGHPDHRVMEPGGDEGMTRGFFATYYGGALKRILDARGARIEDTTCETAGGGVVYMQFEDRRSAARAAEVTRRPVCRLPDAIFADDYVNGAREQLQDFCARLGGSVVRPHPHTGPVRAKMVPGLSFTSSTVQWPQNGGWLAEMSGGSTQLFVLAGGDERSSIPGKTERTRNGLIQIMRVSGSRYDQDNKFVVVHGTGAIKITKAPVGKGLPKSVLAGDISFTSQSETTGTLHLKSDTITLNR